MRKLDFKNVFQINLTEISYDIMRKTPFCSNETMRKSDILMISLYYEKVSFSKFVTNCSK